VIASTSACGTVTEPVVMARRLLRSVSGHAGWARIAWIVVGTSTVRVGLSRAIAASVASGAKRRWITTVAPSWSAGVVWMLSPPTWKNGNTVRMRSSPVMPCRWWLMAALQPSASCRSTAPFGRPGVPDV
jgi:hypothetical protein